MPPTRAFSALALFSVLSLAQSAPAVAGEIIADRDSYVFGGGKPGNDKTDIPGQESNFGKRGLLELKTTATKPDSFTRKIYLGFDPRSIPASFGTISLRLVLRDMNPGPGGDKILTEQPLKVFLLKPSAKGADWSEGEGVYAEKTENGALAGSLHWLNSPANHLNSGDRFTPSLVIEAADHTLPVVLEKDREIVIPLSPAAVQSLKSGSHGDRATLMISISEGTDDLVRFHSREARKAGLRPALVW